MAKEKEQLNNEEEALAVKETLAEERGAEAVQENAQAEVAVAVKEKKPKRKSIFGRWMIIIGAIVLAFFITGLVLGLTPVRVLNHSDFDGWLFVNVYDAQNPDNPFVAITNNTDDGCEQNERFLNIFNRGLRSTQYSILTSLFEFNYTMSPRFRTIERTRRTPRYNSDGTRAINEDNEPLFNTTRQQERIELEIDDVVERTRTREGTFMLEFIYATQGQPRRQMTIRDNSAPARQSGERNRVVEFDTIRILIHDSRNSITDFTIFIFDSEASVHAPNEQHYRPTPINPVQINFNSTRLYTRLLDIREVFRGDRNNGVYQPDTTPEFGPDDGYDFD